MPTDALQSLLLRHGDGLYRLALLREPPAAAQQTLLEVVAMPGAGSITVDRLRSDLLRRRMSFRPRWPWLSRPLHRVGGWERAALWLWLCEAVPGPQLAALANLPADTLALRLAAALLRILPDPRSAEPLYRSEFALWLTERLGLPVLGGNHAAVPEREQWAQRLVDVRALLVGAVGAAHLPPACARALGELLAHGDEPLPERRAWRVPALLAVVLGLALLLARPSRGQSQPEPTPAPVAARDLVRDAAALWLQRPADGVRHRRVVAAPPDAGPGAPPLLTDVWDEAATDRHRVEVRSGEQLVEWQTGDGSRDLRYAAEPRWSSCRWHGAGVDSVLDGRQLLFTADRATQAAMRAQRLQQGAFGQGLVFLERALAAPELVSFGSRPTGGSAELTLRFTDTAGPAPRTLLLTLDARTRALRAVHQIDAVGARRVTRELWRLVADEQVNTPILMTAPPWPEASSTPRQLLDRACPALLAERVPSLRTVAGDAQWQVWLPRTVPPGVEAGVLVSAQASGSNAQPADGTEVLLIGAGRLLSVRPRLLAPSALPAIGVVHHRWRFFAPPDGDTQLRACLSAPEPDLCAGPLLEISARGWEPAALREIVGTLAPLDMALWSRYEPLFVDPQPLAPEVRAALVAAAQAEADPPEGLRYLAVQRTIRTTPQLPEWPDPYHLPQAVLTPERVTFAQWRRTSNGALTRLDQLQTTVEGELLATLRIDHTHADVYWRKSGIQSISSRSPATERAPQPLTAQLLGGLFGSAAPITLTGQNNLLILEQRQPGMDDPLDALDPAPALPWRSGIVAGSVVLRVALDAADHRVRWSERSATQPSGLSVVLARSTVISSGGTAPPRFVAPPLPTDTLTIREQTADTPPAVMSTHMELRLPRRALVWPASPDRVVESDRNSFSQTQTMVGQPIGSALILPNLESPIYGFDTTLLKITRYRLSGLEAAVTIRQGPREFLAHVLRYQSQSMLDETHRWLGSRAVAVRIAGAERTGWIITHRFETALVVEVDDVLLYITSGADVSLDGPLLRELEELEWEELGR